MIADKSSLRVTPSQHRQLARWAECVRLTYNWALSEWERQYADHRAGRPAWNDPTATQAQPTRREIVRLFTTLNEAGRLPSWAAEPPAHTRNRAVRDVERAWRNYFDGRAARPRPKRRSDRASFYLHNQSLRIEGRTVRVGKLGTLRLSRAPRYGKHKVMSATVSYEHGRWHIAIVRDLDRQRQRAPEGAVGVHLGVRAHATVSDGTAFRATGMTAAERRRLRRLQRVVARRGVESPHGRLRTRRGGRPVRVSPGSNREKAVRRLNAFRGRVTRRAGAERHAFTRALARAAAAVGVANVSAQQKLQDERAAGLHRAIGEAAWNEIRRQLEYKVAEHGGRLVTVEAAYTAAECSACGSRSGSHPPASERRTWTCEACGARHHRDLNTARNIARRAAEEVALAAGSPAADGLGRPAGGRTPGTPAESG